MKALSLLALGMSTTLAVAPSNQAIGSGASVSSVDVAAQELYGDNRSLTDDFGIPSRASYGHLVAFQSDPLLPTLALDDAVFLRDADLGQSYFGAAPVDSFGSALTENFGRNSEYFNGFATDSFTRFGADAYFGNEGVGSFTRSSHMGFSR